MLNFPVVCVKKKKKERKNRYRGAGREIFLVFEGRPGCVKITSAETFSTRTANRTSTEIKNATH